MIDPWLVLLAGADLEARREAAWNLGRLGDRRATLPLLEALSRAEREEDRGFGQIICRALGQLRDKRALPRLLEIVSTGSGIGCRNAIEALGVLGEMEAAPVLIRALARPEDRVMACVALGRLGQPGAQFGTVRPLKEGMRWGLIQPRMGGRKRGRPVFFQFGDWDGLQPPCEDLLVSYYVVEVREKVRAIRVRPVERAGEPEQVEVSQELASGTVRWFDTARGYGFLETDSGQRLFVHYRDVRGQSRHRSLTAGQRVSFRLATSERGTRAVDVRPLTQDSGSEGSPPPRAQP